MIDGSKLTIAQRHEIYVRMLAMYTEEVIIEGTNYLGLCWILDSAMLSLNYKELCHCETIATFPELIKHKTKVSWMNAREVGVLTGDTSSYFWWSTEDTESRINAINQAIKETT